MENETDFNSTLKQELQKQLKIYFETIKKEQRTNVPTALHMPEEYFYNMLLRITNLMLDVAEVNPQHSEYTTACRRSSTLMMAKQILDEQLNYAYELKTRDERREAKE